MPRVAKHTPLVVFAFESLLGSADRRMIERLAGQVWRDNVANGLTGEMCFAGRRVRQVVEGPCDVILPLVARILGDGRHRGIRITTLEAVAARRYAGWSVGGLTAQPLAGGAVAEAEAHAEAEAGGRVVPFRRPAAAPVAA